MSETMRPVLRKRGRALHANNGAPALLFLESLSQDRREIPRLLRRWNPQWRIETVVEWDDAAQLLNENKFDAIVAGDAKAAQAMADMFGQSQSLGELLDCRTLNGALKQRSPKCDRPADDCASGSTVPFDRLKTQLAKAKFFAQILQHDGMLDLVAEFMNLQSSPSIYNELLNRLEATDSTMAEVGELIGRHDDMSTLLIRKVNSAVCAQERRIDSPLHAASLLGMEHIRTVLTSTALSQQANPAEDTILQHSLRVALIARRIASHEGCAGDERDAAFAAGLLHDIGKAALGEVFPDEYQRATQRAVDEKRRQVDVEVEVFGASHDSIGAELLSLWGSPASVVRAVGMSHQRFRDEEELEEREEDKLAAYVAVANIVCHSRGQRERARQRQLRKQLKQQGLQSLFNRWHAAGLFLSAGSARAKNGTARS